MKIWMEVTTDKYELPLKVADTGGELARMCGLSPDTIYSSISHYNNRTRKLKRFRQRKRKFICVEVDDEQN